MDPLNSLHSSLVKPGSSLGLWGSSCSVLEDVCLQLMKWIGAGISIAYEDLKHESKEQPEVRRMIGKNNEPVLLSNSSVVAEQLPDFWNALHRLHLVNAHHLDAGVLWLYWDGKKDFPMADRERLKKTRLITLPEALWENIDEVRSAGLLHAECIVVPIEKKTAWCEWVRSFADATKPELMGLILAGGKSRRMQTDKSMIPYHGIPQMFHLAKMLKNEGLETCISIHESRTEEVRIEGFTPIEDQVRNIGPLSGILSAFMRYPNTAFLVLACDLPLLEARAIRKLIRARNSLFAMTAFFNEERLHPEPLAAIWEPVAFRLALNRLADGLHCPVKLSKTWRVQGVKADKPEWIMNVNTLAEKEQAMKQIKK